MSCPKGGKEHPTPHTFLLWNYSQVGSFPLWSLHEGVRHARFRLMSDVDASIDDSRPR